MNAVTAEAAGGRPHRTSLIVRGDLLQRVRGQLNSDGYGAPSRLRPSLTTTDEKSRPQTVGFSPPKRNLATLTPPRRALIAPGHHGVFEGLDEHRAVTLADLRSPHAAPDRLDGSACLSLEIP
jgi:hypothetical protein